MKSLTIISMLALAPAAWSTTLYYSLDTPSGKLGTSQQYFSDGVLITAYGYDLGKTDDLYGKVNGTTDSGLGLMGDSSHEIENDSFVQLNLSNIWLQDPTSVQLSIASAQRDEGYEIFGSNTLGTLGTRLQTGDADAPASFTLVSNAKNYAYISIEAATDCGSVLVDSVTAYVPVGNVPEPGSFALMGAGLIGMASFVSRLRK